MISVILPTYNEREGIVGVIQNILKPNQSVEVLVVDDSSPDGTAQIVKTAFQEDSRVRVIVRQEKGLASAVRRGIEESKGDTVLITDADGNYDGKYIQPARQLLNSFDVVNGSRYIKGGGMVGFSKIHYWESRFFNFAVRILLGMKTTDNTSGFLIFKKELFNGLEADRVFSGVHGEYNVELLYALQKLKVNLTEMPVVCQARKEGKSKTSLIKHPLMYAARALRLRLGL